MSQPRAPAGLCFLEHGCFPAPAMLTWPLPCEPRGDTGHVWGQAGAGQGWPKALRGFLGASEALGLQHLVPSASPSCPGITPQSWCRWGCYWGGIPVPRAPRGDSRARSCPQQEHRAACVGTHRPQPRREGRPGGGTGKNLVPGARALPARAALLSPLGTSRAGGRGAVRWPCHQARRGQAGRARLCCSSSQHRQPPAALSGSGGWTPGQVSRWHFSPHAERRWRCFTARAGAWGPSPALCSPWGRGVEVWLFPWLCHGAVLPLLGARRSGQGAAPGQRAEAGHGAGHGARPRPPSSSRRGERAVSAAG